MFVRSACGWACALSLVLVWIPAAADQGSAAIAEKLFDEGRDLMAQGRYDRACPKLAESHRLDPAVGTLLNLGACYEKQGKLASAWATYREAEPMARRLNQTERARHAADRAAALESRLSYLTVHVAKSVEGQEVRLDEQPIDAAAWGTAVPVDPGAHTLESTAPAHAPYRATVKIERSGAKVVVEVPALAPAPTPRKPTEPAPSPAPAPPPDSGGTQRTLGWVAVGVGAASLVAGTIFGALAKSANDEARSDHCSAVDCDARGVDLISRAQDHALVSTILFVVSGVSVAGGLTLVLTAPSSSATALRGVSIGGRF